MRRALVTGGAGFIGSHLVDALLAQGWAVRVLDQLVSQVHEDGRPRNLSPDAELVVASVQDREAVDRALDGVSVVFHKAAEVGVGQSMYEIDRYVSTNSLGTATLLQAMIARRDAIRKLVVASSMSIYGEGAFSCESCGDVAPVGRPHAQLVDHRWEVECPGCGRVLTPVSTGEAKRAYPSSVYAISKQNQEQLALVVGQAYGIPTVAFRYFNVYGPGQALTNPYTGVCAIFGSRLLNNQSPVVFEDGRQTRDLVHVSDIVRANLLALETDGADYRAVNIGSGKAVSILELARMMAKGLGKDIEPQLLGRFREGDVRHCVADVSLASESLGFVPGVQLEDGIPELLEWVATNQAPDGVPDATSELESHRLVY